MLNNSSAIKNGMSFNTPIFQEFFAGVFGESWQGYEFKDFEIVRIKHKAKVTSQLKEKLKRISGTKFIIVSDLEMTVALSLGRIQREINMIFSSLTEIQILFRPPN